MTLSNPNNANERTPAETTAVFQELVAAMTPEAFRKHIEGVERLARESEQQNERDEIVCRLLASGMTAEAISLILCIRAEAVRIIESNYAATQIPKYAKSYKERLRRREQELKKQNSWK